MNSLSFSVDTFLRHPYDPAVRLQKRNLNVKLYGNDGSPGSLWNETTLQYITYRFQALVLEYFLKCHFSREALYFLLHDIYLALKIRMFAHKTYETLIKMVINYKLNY